MNAIQQLFEKIDKEGKVAIPQKYYRLNPSLRYLGLFFCLALIGILLVTGIQSVLGIYIANGNLTPAFMLGSAILLAIGGAIIKGWRIWKGLAVSGAFLMVLGVGEIVVNGFEFFYARYKMDESLLHADATKIYNENDAYNVNLNSEFSNIVSQYNTAKTSSESYLTALASDSSVNKIILASISLPTIEDESILEDNSILVLDNIPTMRAGIVASADVYDANYALAKSALEKVQKNFSSLKISMATLAVTPKYEDVLGALKSNVRVIEELALEPQKTAIRSFTPSFGDSLVATLPFSALIIFLLVMIYFFSGQAKGLEADFLEWAKKEGYELETTTT